MEEDTFSGDFASEIANQIASIEHFKPLAFYTKWLQEVKVLHKDCSYTASPVILSCIDLLWENHRPWYKPWERSVGFSIYCPSRFGFSGVVRVSAILEEVERQTSLHLGEHRNLLYRLAGQLEVRIS